MPTYVYACLNGHRTQVIERVSQYRECVPCEICQSRADRVFTPPLLVAASPDVHYTSPVTGIPIQSHAARREDMARHGAVEYDPEMTKDVERRREESWQAFEADIDRTVEESIAKMTTAQRNQLAREVIDEGLTAEPVRQSV